MCPGYRRYLSGTSTPSKDSKVTDYLVTLFSLCINYGIVPETFAHGLLIPLVKKPSSHPSVASNYRPVVICVTFTKLFEIYMLDRCGEYEFHDLQFDFVPGRGTTMAAALAHDVINYCNIIGSTVYACSLGAEAAFDGIPHSVMFSKLKN